MDGRKRFTVEDLWTPDQPLPARPVLQALARRCGEAWDFSSLGERVRIAYNPRMRTALGRALLEEARVELNPHLLREHPEELVPTLVHELAHVAVHQRFGGARPHGREFRTLMRAVNLSAEATHSLETARPRRRRRARYLYVHRCETCGYTFAAGRTRRDRYCAACGPEMSWTIVRLPDTPKARQALARMRRRQAK